MNREDIAENEEYQISKYIIIDTLGYGGSSEVKLVCDVNTEQFYAMKKCRCRKDAKVEAEILRMLNHPGIPKLHDYFEIENDAYLVTEYVKGKTIDELQREGSYRDGLTYDITAGTCKQGGSFEVAVKLAEILCYIHTFPTPLVHGDLKPENIILTKSGEVKLIDFGSAHFLGEEPETIRSTPGFAAPEMEKGRSGLRSDVYAFGMIYAQLMSGKRLDFAGKNTAFLMRMGLNKSEAKVVQCCLNVRESQRYPSGKEVLKALKACDSKERIRCVIKQWKSFICTDVGGVLVFLGLMIFYLLNQYRGKYLILAGCILLLIQLISSSRKRISGDGEYTVLSSVFLAEN